MGGLLSTQPRLNEVVTMGGLRREFDILMPIGAAGINFSSFGNYTITSSDALRPNGDAFAGQSGTNDFLFYPTLRFDGTSNGSGYYWLGPGPGIDNEVSATVTGFFDGNVNPLTMTVTAILPAYVAPPLPAPEPTSLALMGLGLCGAVLLRGKRK